MCAKVALLELEIFCYSFLSNRTSSFLAAVFTCFPQRAGVLSLREKKAICRLALWLCQILCIPRSIRKPMSRLAASRVSDVNVSDVNVSDVNVNVSDVRRPFLTPPPPPPPLSPILYCKLERETSGQLSLEQMLRFCGLACLLAASLRIVSKVCALLYAVALQLSPIHMPTEKRLQ